MARKTSKKRSYPYTKKSSSSIVKRAKGNIAASKKQNDVADFTITFNHSFPVCVHYESDYATSGKYQSGYALNIWDLLSKAPNFKAFQSMYDQVRINGVQIKLGTTNGGATSDQEQNTIYNVFTAWDSNGMDKRFIQPVHTPASSQEAGKIDVVGYRTCLNTAIATYGSASKLQLNKYQRWTQNRSLYPSNMSEKTQFVSCDSIFDFHHAFDTETGKRYFEFKPDYKALIDNVPENDVFAEFYTLLNQDNPALPTSNAKYPFKPTFYVDAYKTEVDNTNHKVNPYTPIDNATVLMFTAEIRVPCTFRGLKGVAEVHEVQPNKQITITENNQYLILPDTPYDSMKTVTALVNVPSSGALQPLKEVTIQNNGLTTISPSSGYDGMEQVNATVNINHNNQISYMKLYSEDNVLVDTFDFDDMTYITQAQQITIQTNNSLVVIIRQQYGYEIVLISSYSQNITFNCAANSYYKINSGKNNFLSIYNYEDLIIGEIGIQQPNSVGETKPRLYGQTYIRDSYFDQAMIGQISNYPITTNGSIDVPIPVPYSVVDRINLNVNIPTKIYIDRIGYEGGTYLFSNFSINTTDNYINVPSRKMFFNFVLYNTSIRYKMLVNNTPGNINIRPYVNTNTHQGYYIVADYSSTVVESIYLKTSNDENVIMITDDDTLDSSAISGYVFRQFIDFVI